MATDDGNAAGDQPPVATRSTSAAASAVPTFGEFLRSRRERLSPDAAGLPPGGRRRTPGLRREELALLAGISVDYLTRLEQGRETNPSQDVLQALSRALRLSQSEWQHVLHLLGMVIKDLGCAGPLPDMPVDRATRAILDQLDPAPAFLLIPGMDVVAWNRSFNGLMGSAGLFDLHPPNLLRYIFLTPAARTFFLEWEACAANQVGNLRAAVGRWFNDHRLRDLVGELSVASADFAHMWSNHTVATKASGRQHVNHPVEGELFMSFQVMEFPAQWAFTLITYLPEDPATEESLERLRRTGRAGVVDPTGGGSPSMTSDGPADAPRGGTDGAHLRLVTPD
jgi:transcriptional regulator with XRE-family HTH domain